MSFSDQKLSVVYRCRRWRSHFLLSRTTGPIATKLGHRILRWSKFKFVQMKGPALFHGEISKIVKILKRKLTWPIYTKLGTKLRWVNDIQLCSNERACFFPRGIIMKSKIILKKFRNRLLQNHSTNFDQTMCNVFLCKGSFYI